MTVVTRFTYGDGSVTEIVADGDSRVEITHSAAGVDFRSAPVVMQELEAADANLNPMAEENLSAAWDAEVASAGGIPASEIDAESEEERKFGVAAPTDEYEAGEDYENLNPMASENMTSAYAAEAEGSTLPAPAPLTADAAAAKGRALPAFIRGAYTALFSLLGMAGAAFAYLKDNLSSLSDLSWTTWVIVGLGALLAGLGYGLKKYYKPDGLL